MATMKTNFTTHQEQAQFVSHIQLKLFLSEEQAVTLSKELIDRFLPIKRYLKDFDDATVCSPSPLIDAAWHELILFTKLYAKICGKTFIHHNPIRELDAIQVKAARYERTLQAYDDLFGTRPSDEEIWPLVYPGSESEEDGNNHNPSGQVQKKQQSSSSPPVATSSGSKRKATTATVAGARRRSQRNHSEGYQIFVNCWLSGQRYTVQVEPTTTIDEIKARLQRMVDIPIGLHRLCLDGERIEGCCTLADLEIENNDCLDLVPIQSGC